MGVLLTAVLALSLVACSDGPSSAPESSPTQDADGVPIPADLDQAFTATLDTRAAALRRHQRARFVSGLERSDAGFVTAQRGYYDNLAQLPLERFSYDLDRSSMVRTGDEYWVVVEVTMQLAGYDPEPVVTSDRFRFAATDDDRYVVSSTTDSEWERTNDIQPQPWDMVPIEVRTAPGVLGIFDEKSVAAADTLMDSIAQGVDDVSVAVPFGWSREVVVYALSDSDFLATLDELPGGDPEHVDGVAFPVMAGDEDGDVVTTRFALHPSMLWRAGPERDRLVRHELTHVAIGERDDQAPAWLSEGIAEWVSVQPLIPELRRLPEEALGAAEAGVRRLPADGTFNNADSAAHYGLSWWACEYLVAGFGVESMWQLLEELDRRGDDQDEALEALIGLSGKQLARRAAKMMINEYDPDFLAPEPPETTETPETPDTSEAPQATPTGGTD
jgi:hypothetical protein